ncbi:hypothetical protein [Agromyces seonyuensis]|uniref:Uncharacterized protein n=1 Tax=Agromyces seonyuensis TaxID=2662446 RepID=A0A6I4P5D8_9MICO|nr:hypothetical protein [Agromyces seonyuensis]MWB98737.1 hypothetical protein [Agromyces seonyuensis]
MSSPIHVAALRVGTRAAGDAAAAVAIGTVALLAIATVVDAPSTGAAAVAATLLLTLAVLAGRRATRPVAVFVWVVVGSAALAAVLAAFAGWRPGAASDSFLFVLPQLALLFLLPPQRSTGLPRVLWLLVLLAGATSAAAVGAMVAGSPFVPAVAVLLVWVLVAGGRPLLRALRGRVPTWSDAGPGPGGVDRGHSLRLLAVVVAAHLDALLRNGSGAIGPVRRGAIDLDLVRLLGAGWRGAAPDEEADGHGWGTARIQGAFAVTPKLSPLAAAPSIAGMLRRGLLAGACLVVGMSGIATLVHAGEITHPDAAAVSLLLVLAAAMAALQAARHAAGGANGVQWLFAATMLGIAAAAAEFVSTLGRDTRTYDDIAPLALGMLLIGLAPAFGWRALLTCGGLAAVPLAILAVAEVGTGLRDTPLVFCVLAAVVPVLGAAIVAAVFSRTVVRAACAEFLGPSGEALRRAEAEAEPDAPHGARSLREGVDVLAGVVRNVRVDRTALDRARYSLLDIQTLAADGRPPHRPALEATDDAGGADGLAERG